MEDKKDLEGLLWRNYANKSESDGKGCAYTPSFDDEEEDGED